MALRVDFRQFLDEEGNVLTLTEQATTVFKFLSNIVLSVSQQPFSQQSISFNNEQPLIDVNLKCNTRADELTCTGSIEASCVTIGIIKWHCDTCAATGSISNWQGSFWDKQKRTLH